MSGHSAEAVKTHSRTAALPRYAETLLLSLLPAEVGESVAGDLAEIFESVILPGSGRLSARLWYWRQVFCSLRLLLRFRTSPHPTFEAWKRKISPTFPRNHQVAYHQGIRIDRIRVQGSMGLLFVFATIFIFGMGIPAVRVLAAITGLVGILGSGVLYYWHTKHAPENRSLDLHESRPAPGSRVPEPRAGKEPRQP
jgi:hypothetical protein